MAIAQQLQAESTEQNNTGQTVSVTLGAGSSRYMVVALCAEVASLAAPSSVTYGGNALALITDGSVTASNISTAGGVFLYRLLEASMPANGAQNLTVSWGATTNYIMGWWILTGVNQANASDVKNTAETTTATTITATLDAGATTDAVICAVYKNDTTGAVAITISGAGVTEDFDVSLATGGARGSAGTDLPAVASGTIACVATVSSTTRRIITAIRLAEAASSATISGGFSTGSVAIAGDVDNVATIGGGFSTGPATLTGDVDNVATIGGGFSIGPSLVSGDVTTLASSANISGGFVTSKVTLGGTAEILNRAIGGPTIAAGPVIWGADVAPLISLSGGFTTGPVQVSGTVVAPATIGGGFSIGVTLISGTLVRQREISGGFSIGAVQVSGTAATQIRTISGAIVLRSVQVSGSVSSQHGGRVALLDSAFGSAELLAGDFGSATLLPEEFGSATLEAL